MLIKFLIQVTASKREKGLHIFAVCFHFKVSERWRKQYLVLEAQSFLSATVALHGCQYSLLHSCSMLKSSFWWFHLPKAAGGGLWAKNTRPCTYLLHFPCSFSSSILSSQLPSPVFHTTVKIKMCLETATLRRNCSLGPWCMWVTIKRKRDQQNRRCLFVLNSLLRIYRKNKLVIGEGLFLLISFKVVPSIELHALLLFWREICLQFFGLIPS